MEKEYVSPLLTRPARSRDGRTGTSGEYEEDTGMLKLESSDQNVEDIITQIQSRGQQGGV
jgi:hypothetical protein